ncbi:MAG: ribonuclease HII [archaeon]|nr:ribonuclease HII [archaeon]
MLCGIDEAGRGSVLGPLVVGAVYAEDDTIFRDIGVKDSKQLTPNERELMFDQIIDAASSHSVSIITAEDIDKRRKNASLNNIELDMFVEVASKLPVVKVYADCLYINENIFSNVLSFKLGSIRVIGRHKADEIYPIVSAASIVAKVTRDRMIQDIAAEFDADVGSGYPSDPTTMNFIKEWMKKNGTPPKYTRNTWEHIHRLSIIHANTKITDW